MLRGLGWFVAWLVGQLIGRSLGQLVVGLLVGKLPSLAIALHMATTRRLKKCSFVVIRTLEFRLTVYA